MISLEEHVVETHGKRQGRWLRRSHDRYTEKLVPELLAARGPEAGFLAALVPCCLGKMRDTDKGDPGRLAQDGS